MTTRTDDIASSMATEIEPNFTAIEHQMWTTKMRRVIKRGLMLLPAYCDFSITHPGPLSKIMKWLGLGNV